MKSRIISIGLGLILLTFVSFGEETNLQILIESLFPVPSPTGYEEPLVQAIRRFLPPDLDIKRDNLGSLYISRGGNGAGLTVCAAMDEAGGCLDREGSGRRRLDSTLGAYPFGRDAGENGGNSGSGNGAFGHGRFFRGCGQSQGSGDAGCGNALAGNHAPGREPIPIENVFAAQLQRIDI